KSLPCETRAAFQDGALWPPGTVASWESLRICRRPHLRHGKPLARRMIGDLGHVVPHEEQSTAAGPFEVFRGHGIGHVLRLKAGAFIGDTNLEAILGYVIRDVNLL